jgi:hypothetical protein
MAPVGITRFGSLLTRFDVSTASSSAAIVGGCWRN